MLQRRGLVVAFLRNVRSAAACRLMGPHRRIRSRFARRAAHQRPRPQVATGARLQFGELQDRKSLEASGILTNADVYGTPCPHVGRNMHPRECGAAIPVGQKHPFVVPEAAEAEVPSVFEKVAANDPAVPEVHATVAITAEPLVVVISAKVFAATVLVVQASIATLLIVYRSALRSVVHTAEL